MPANRPKKQEPLLNTVARTLGHAAGKLTQATQKLTENLSALPGTVTTKLREPADSVPAERKRPRGRRTEKKIRNAGRARGPKAATATARRRPPKG